MVIVLCDSGILKFVKYVSKNVKGDRWDFFVVYDVEELEDEDGEVGLFGVGVSDDDDEEEEEFNGFFDVEESELD